MPACWLDSTETQDQRYEIGWHGPEGKIVNEIQAVLLVHVLARNTRQTESNTKQQSKTSNTYYCLYLMIFMIDGSLHPVPGIATIQ